MGFKKYLEKIESEMLTQEQFNRITNISVKVSDIAEKILIMSSSKLVLSNYDKEDLFYFQEILKNMNSDDVIINFQKRALLHAIDDLMPAIDESEYIEELLTHDELIEMAVLRDQIIGILSDVICYDAHVTTQKSNISVVVDIPVEKIDGNINKFNCLKYMLLNKGIKISDNCISLLMKNNEKYGYYDFSFEIQDRLKMFGFQRTIVKK